MADTLKIETNGRIGIGTSPPSTHLHVVSEEEHINNQRSDKLKKILDYEERDEILNNATLQDVLEWNNLQPTENPLSDCYGCTAGMCNPHSRISECKGDQYEYGKGSWRPFKEEYLINQWRLKKLNEISNF